MTKRTTKKTKTTKAAKPTKGLSARVCMRCHEAGNVEHDNDVAMCNRCTDEIQHGGHSHYRCDVRLPPAVYGDDYDYDDGTN